MIGGPTMVVHGYGPPDSLDKVLSGGRDKYVVCHWFSGKKLESGHFSSEELVMVKDDGAKQQAD